MLGRRRVVTPVMAQLCSQPRTSIVCPPMLDVPADILVQPQEKPQGRTVRLSHAQIPEPQNYGQNKMAILSRWVWGIFVHNNR